MGILRGSTFGPGISLGFVGSPRDPFVFLFLPPIRSSPSLKNMEYPLPLELGCTYKYILLSKGVHNDKHRVVISEIF